MKHPLVLLCSALFIFFIAVAVFMYFFAPSPMRTVIVEIRGQSVTAELAETILERTQGLSGRDSLDDDAGMLFLFDTLERHTMWMKGMKFPIDIVWIKNGKIIDIAEGAKPEPDVPGEFLTRYAPDIPAELVLELPAGFISRNEIMIGDEVSLVSGMLPSKYRAFLR